MGNVTNPALRLVVCSFVLSLLLVAMVGCGEESTPEYEARGSSGAEGASESSPALSSTAREGEDLFNANCSVCHGLNAAGTNQGPTLIDRIYHPSHHPDFSFRNAVSKGVRQHHWVFGDMPPAAGVSSDDVEKIICYVREVQRTNGIFEGPDNFFFASYGTGHGDLTGDG